RSDLPILPLACSARRAALQKSPLPSMHHSNASLRKFSAVRKSPTAPAPPSRTRCHTAPAHGLPTQPLRPDLTAFRGMLFPCHPALLRAKPGPCAGPIQASPSATTLSQFRPRQIRHNSSALQRAAGPLPLAFGHNQKTLLAPMQYLKPILASALRP